ncbi:androgen-dependent TFPI-regulating protein isoform X2 [Pieris rapae]|uniref:androgen-dependent TFPI-regulating protein isoform X2 n=1 Tax=Pieris rapae TaxID=64459 RepID=UPI001E27FC71|nr:androgen-dependent TFPI-regulating protein isoform X2 [Pieris rapae]XP_045486634.1 androgen-dependent TFPI-regulating protein isoform X2 [Pieris rapae]
MGKSDLYMPIRLAGDLVFFAAHGINIIVMHLALQTDIMKEKDLTEFHSLQWKYITIWNLAFQNVYLLMAIVCDISSLFKILEENKIMEQMKRYRKTFFSGVVWPSSILVSTLFWPIFLYDRELVFPSYIDKVLSTASNHMIHSFITVVVVWELITLPRSMPKSHKWNLMQLAVIYVAYLVVFITNYHITGLWPYPLLYSIYGTIYFPLFLFAVLIIYLIAYFIQWPLVSLIHGSSKKVAE